MKRENIRTNKSKKIEKAPKEVTELLRVKKKYDIKYVMLCNLFELHIIFLFIILCFILAKQIFPLIALSLIYIIIVVSSLILYKKSATGTYISFQENKVVYRRKFLFINKREEMLYKDIKEITFHYESNIYFKFWQKKLNLGNMVICPKKGNSFIYGMAINNIAPLDKIMVDVKNNVGDKIK